MKLLLLILEKITFEILIRTMQYHKKNLAVDRLLIQLCKSTYKDSSVLHCWILCSDTIMFLSNLFRSWLVVNFVVRLIKHLSNPYQYSNNSKMNVIVVCSRCIHTVHAVFAVMWYNNSTWCYIVISFSSKLS